MSINKHCDYIKLINNVVVYLIYNNFRLYINTRVYWSAYRLTTQPVVKFVVL